MLLKIRLGANYLQYITNPDVLGGGLLKIDTTFVTVDSIVFTADNYHNIDITLSTDLLSSLRARAVYKENTDGTLITMDRLNKSND